MTNEASLHNGVATINEILLECYLRDYFLYPIHLMFHLYHVVLSHLQGASTRFYIWPRNLFVVSNCEFVTFPLVS